MSTWTEAEDLCQKTNGHLASILTSNEEVEIQKLTNDDCKNYWWIGLKWESKLQRFTWSDQSHFMNFKNIKNGLDKNTCFYVTGKKPQSIGSLLHIVNVHVASCASTRGLLVVMEQIPKPLLLSLPHRIPSHKLYVLRTLQSQ